MKKTLHLTILLMACVLISFSAFSQVINPRTLPQEWGEYGIGDPYMLKFRGKYYLYCSTRDDQTGVKCWSSWNMTNWNYEGLVTTESITKGAYAPEVNYWNGTFYMYTSPAGRGHYVLSSASPTGPFVLRTGNFGRTIDGSVFIDDDGSKYFSYAGGDGIQAATMSDMITVNGAAVNINARSRGWTEGSTIFKRNGLYYVIYTGNHVFSKGYRVYCSTSTDPLGPYNRQKENPIVLHSEGSFFGLGHSCNIIGPDLDTWYIAYHNLLGQSSIIGPNRKLNIDPVAFNGNQLSVLGPTNWSQQAPRLPAFYDRWDRNNIGNNWQNINGGNWGIYNQELLWQDNRTGSSWFRQVSSSSTASDYTAEFNMKEMGRGADNARFGVVFSYTDENNYGQAVLSSFLNRIEVNFKVNGGWTGEQFVNLPAGYDYQKWHSMRVEKSGNVFKVYIDGMLKFTRNEALNGGKIGVTTFNDHADFGYIAFNNAVNGSAIYDIPKPIPGEVQAVHFSNAYDNSGGNIGGGYRSGNVDIRANPEGGFNIGWNATGEWYEYKVNVKESGFYNLGLRYATTFASSKVKIQCDNSDVTGVTSLPSTGDWNNWITHNLKNLYLPVGEHIIKLQTVEGEFDFYTLEFVKSTNNSASGGDNFDSGYNNLWNYSNGDWTISNGNAYSPDFGKRVMGSSEWHNYTVSADIICPATGNAGIMFRVKNPANGGAGNDSQLGTDFFQGYYVGIQSGNIVLGKENYEWQELASAPYALSAGQWYNISVRAYDNNFQIYVNNSLVINHTDNDPFINGRVGLRSHATRTFFNNFSVNGTPNNARKAGTTESMKHHSPNPVNDVLMLKDDQYNDSTLHIYSTDGRLIKTVKVENNSVNVEELSPGIYLLQAEESVVTKFVKQ
ncbi:family 43 glycosylhydrolase [Fulvivirga ligni]|uniref:family 43 glycosylhydrolase n=1 Tax=Fulvivirga ligni TaxID=2904246 RepID=UPI001F16981E|nr:family 43 glycosylhydrolase [Fulvivirga ligni]UII23785.1 family 43 glycosylhydrolase [Fulvivirga ligni]